MSDLAYAMVIASDEGGEIRFERLLPHPLTKVWAAITESDRLAEWLAEGEIEPRVGGRVHLAFTVVDPPAILETTVIEADPPRLISFPFGGEADGVVRIELAEAEGGTLLTLTQSRVATTSLADNAAGWHARIEMLEAALESGMQELSWDRIGELNARYGELTATLS